MDATSIKYTLFVMMIDGWCYNVQKPSYVQYAEGRDIDDVKAFKNTATSNSVFLFTNIRRNILSGHADYMRDLHDPLH